MPTAWRIVKTARLRAAFDGEGARLHGGRWNSPGTALVYTAESQALAALELLVHLQSSQLLLSYSAVPASFDAESVEVLDPGRLPRGWRRYPASPALQQLGDRWAAELRSAVLQVPSAVVPDERNFLLNPAHPDFKKIRIGPPAPFEYDARLK
jgi:RES domain-containing protein